MFINICKVTCRYVSLNVLIEEESEMVVIRGWDEMLVKVHLLWLWDWLNCHRPPGLSLQTLFRKNPSHNIRVSISNYKLVENTLIWPLPSKSGTTYSTSSTPQAPGLWRFLLKNFSLKVQLSLKLWIFLVVKWMWLFYKYLSKSSESSFKGWKKMIGKESNFSLSLFI